MLTIPLMSTVADLQRAYRKTMDTIKKSGEPMIIVNNGKPEGILMDVKTYEAQVEKLIDMETEYLIKIKNDAIKDYKTGKTIQMGDNETLMDVLNRVNEN